MIYVTVRNMVKRDNSGKNGRNVRRLGKFFSSFERRKALNNVF